MCVMRSCIQGRARVCLAPVMLAAGILAFAAPAPAATVTTLDATRDTDMFITTEAQGASSYQIANSGGADRMRVGSALPYWYNRKAIVGFEITSLTVENVQSVTLRLYNNHHSGSSTLNPEVYAISTANKAWVEGTGDESGPVVGAANYDYLAHNTVGWAGSAGLNTAGTDYDSTLLSSAAVSPTTVGTYVDFNFAGTNAQLTSLIDGWRTDNGGLVLSAPGSTENAGFATKEHATAAFRPQLIVTQGPVVPEPSSFVLLVAGLVGLLAYAWRKRK